LYFDLDKSVIRKDAAFELEKVLAVMQEYPKMTIDIRSHTDCRQTVATTKHYLIEELKQPRHG
jgi:outer membrane protein OmpA-like peptidoglycan-associated protein